MTSSASTTIGKRVPKVLKVELEREDDGRWIAEIPSLPGVLVYGDSREDALSKAQALALRVIADMIEETGTPRNEFRFAVA